MVGGSERVGGRRDAGCALAGVPSVLGKDREVCRHRGGWTGGRGEQARRGCCARDCAGRRPRSLSAEPAHAFISRRVSHQSAQGQPVREGGERITRLAGRPKRPNPPVRATHRHHPQGNRIWGGGPQYGGGCPPRPSPPPLPNRRSTPPLPSQLLQTPSLPPTHLNARRAIGGAFNGGPPSALEADHGVAWRPRRQAWRPSPWRQAWRPPAGGAPTPGLLGRRKERSGGK